MPVEFLTAEQRQRYGRFAGEPNVAQLERYFHLDATARAAVMQRRGAHNWLGFALQLGTVRFLGTFLADPTDVPDGVVRYVAEQLGIGDVGCLRDYQDDTRWRHADEISRRYGYRAFSSQPEHWRLVRWLYVRAWMTQERPSVLFDLVTARLVARKILLPGASVLSKLIASVRERASERLWRRLASIPDAACRQRLEGLLHLPAGARQSALDRLRHGVTNPGITGLVEALARVDEVRALGFGALDVANLSPNRITALARYAHAARAAAIARM